MCNCQMSAFQITLKPHTNKAKTNNDFCTNMYGNKKYVISKFQMIFLILLFFEPKLFTNSMSEKLLLQKAINLVADF